MTKQTEDGDAAAESVPLAEAVRCFADPELLQHHDELAAQIASWPRPGTARYRQGWPDEDARHRQYVARLRAPIREAQAAAQKALLEDLLRQLLDGRLIASGLALPPTPSSRRDDIARGLWEILKLQPSAGKAVGKGLQFIRVHVRRAPPRAAAESSDDKFEQTPGRPGPKSIMPQIEAEMRARAGRGELKAGIGAECSALEKWAKIEYPNHPRPPKAKSIQNVLGKLYSELRVNAGS